MDTASGFDADDQIDNIVAFAPSSTPSAQVPSPFDDRSPEAAPIFTAPRRRGDLTFVDRGSSFEVWFSDRIATDHQESVDEFADWLEEQAGVSDLGQIEFDALVADGRMTDLLRIEICTWWAEHLEELHVED